jgi:hypothetical protein
MWSAEIAITAITLGGGVDDDRPRSTHLFLHIRVGRKLGAAEDETSGLVPQRGLDHEHGQRGFARGWRDKAVPGSKW